MYLEQLAQILQSEGIGTIGVDIFYYSAPADAKNYVLLMLGGDGIPYDMERPGYFNTRYQVITRHEDQVEGFNLASDAMQALTFYNTQVDDITFKQSVPKDVPRPYRRNEAGYLEFSNNFLVAFVKD